jgi:UDP-glucose 4-epimerase
MSNKRILVTGGSGAIGSNLVRSLLLRADTECIVTLDNHSSGHRENISDDKKLILVEGDICDDAILEQAFSHGITHVYHLAANFANQNSVNNPVRDLTTNGLGIVKLLEKSVTHNVQKFLYSSSSCVYKPAGEPFKETSPIMLSTPYAITKLLSEEYVTFFNKYKKLPAVIVRYFSNYGPGDYPGRFRSVIPNFLWKAMHGEPITITGTGEETRPFTYVSDIVDGTIAAMEKSPLKIVENHYSLPIDESDNLIYNIGTEKTISMNELAKKVNALCGGKSEIVFVPRRDWDVVPHRPVDASKARRELGYEARVSIDEGLRKTYEWFMSEHFNRDRVDF